MSAKELIQLGVLLIVACAFAYFIDQYYIAGRGFTFFFDILKL